MASIPLSAQAVKAVKTDLTKWFDECKSAHLSEALAYALGFNTNAALLKEMELQGNDPLFYIVDEERLTKRLNALGYPVANDFFFDAADIPEMRETLCLRSFDIEYKTKRQKAWRNLMVSAVNEALRRRLFSLRLDDNRWPSHQTMGSHIFEFQLTTGDLARVKIRDIGHSEIAVEVMLNPRTGGSPNAYYATLQECDAVAMSWLERRDGAWLQSALDSFRCKRHVLERLLTLEVEPLGYGDKGAVK
ncbi:hypothetical protein [Herbaspirillum sp. alder98]|uniref:hypothetical protein n=1 Tax=Herbaspirillum sp. alder98 TaxID=2913096 RepID=UPI001CD8BF8D|nr:hypothetical protein [Herbaspirillum sp. alder98]MCA1326396.1 hypothetical protein [Herbaspirillum sp. alder98]